MSNLDSVLKSRDITLLKWRWSEEKVTQLCPTLWDPMDYIVHGILQARILEWVAFLFFRGSSQPRDWTQVSCIAGRFYTSWATREALANKGPSSQSYGFSSSHVWTWELDYKESWVPKNWCFWAVVLEKALESSLDHNEIKPVHPKGNSLEGLMLKMKLQ